MKRKDILIISAILIFISFISAFVINYVINSENIVSKGEIVENKSEENSNDWETSIVKETKYNVPIPVGFSYVEGTEKTGVIVKNDKTGEEYAWVPSEGTIENEEYAEIMLNMNLEESTEDTRKSIEKYKGFYVAISSNGKSTDLNEIKEKLKNMTEEESRNLELDNKSVTSIVETHTITEEELASIISWDSEIKNRIYINKLQALTLSASGNSKKDEKTEINAGIVNIETGVPIPAGFTYKEGTVDTGFKITNGNNLSFIWIPIKDLEGKSYLLDGITNEDMIKAEEEIKESFTKKLEKSNVEKTNYGGYFEVNASVADIKQDTEKDNSEYEELLRSIAKYGGFYISEAELGYDVNGHIINVYRPMQELGGEGTGYNYVSNGDYFRNVSEENKRKDNLNSNFQKAQKFILSYDNAVKKSKELYESSLTVVSHLTYGIEYNAVINYLSENGQKITKEGESEKKEAINVKDIFEDSTNIGKYAIKEGQKERPVWEKNVSLNRIYGLAGNLAEITQESNNGEVVLRGGRWYTTGNEEPLASVGYVKKESLKEDEGTIGFRVCLYIKPEITKTEYESGMVALGEVKNKKINELKQYISQKSVKVEGNETNYFNSEKIDEDTYKLKILNGIIKEIKEKFEPETSERYLDKILDYEKEQVDSLEHYINKIVEYPKFEFGQSSEECWKIRQETLNKINRLTYDNSKLKYEDGNETTYQEIFDEMKTKIDSIVKEKIIEQVREITIEKATEEQNKEIEGIKTNLINAIISGNDLEQLKESELFYWGVPEVIAENEWKHMETWYVGYSIWKLNGRLAIINGHIDPESEMALINEWISKRIAVADIAEEWMTDANANIKWKQFETEKTNWKNTILNSENEEIAKQNVEKANNALTALIEAQKLEEENRETGEKEETKKPEEDKGTQSKPQQQGGVDEIISGMTLDEKIYQMFFVAPEAITKVGTVTVAGDTTKQALQKYPVGGIIYFASNLQNRSQVQKMIANSQSYSKIPLFIGVDEEGGTVSRLGSNSNMNFPKYGNMSDVGNSQEANNIGKNLGVELKKLGFNLDFAPVADVITNNNNTVVKKRSFGTDANRVANMVENFVKGMESQNVSSVLKHFPGHGSTAGDTHNGVATTNRTLEQLRNAELKPFKKGIEAGSDFVMMAHITLTNIDSSVPATFSKKIVTDILRNELGYNGIVITDAMNMGAIVNQYTTGEAAVKAIQAGVDMILMPTNIDAVHSTIKSAVQNGTISEERINESVRRILTVKKEKIW